MGFFSKLGKVVSAVVKVAAPVVIATAMPEVMINTAVGAVVKHGTPINNGAIPFLNLAVSTAVAYGRNMVTTGGDWQGSLVPALQQGGLLMAASTGLHQALKLPLGSIVGGIAAKAVGPGAKFSL